MDKHRVVAGPHMKPVWLGFTCCHPVCCRGSSSLLLLVLGVAATWSSSSACLLTLSLSQLFKRKDRNEVGKLGLVDALVVPSMGCGEMHVARPLCCLFSSFVGAVLVACQTYGHLQHKSWQISCVDSHSLLQCMLS